MAEVRQALQDATFALGLPLIVVVGLKFGVFTPTEAAVVAAVYAMVVSIFIYGELKISQMYGLLLAAAKTTAVVMFLVAAAMVSAWMITVAQLPDELVKLLKPFLDSPKLLMFIINNAIGLITPPVGTVLNTVAGVGKVSMDDVTKGVMPFMIAQFTLMFLMVLFPQIVMWPARWLTG